MRFDERDGRYRGRLRVQLMRARLLALVAACLLFAMAPARADADPLPAGKGNFAFADPVANPDKPVTVWYYKPPALGPDAKVMFVMHGVDRDGEKYRDRWMRHADRHGFLLVVPQFDERYFPTDSYQFGNAADPRRERWSFQVIERLFDVVRARASLSAEKYILYGHSAGAQFVHRMMILMPSTRVETAFAANAGTYTMPVYPAWHEAGFPNRLDKRLVDEAQLASAFSRKLVVLLGEKDIEESGPGVPNSAHAREQGRHRLERGHNFFRIAQEQSMANKVPLNWQLILVPQVGHSDTGMSNAVMRRFFEPAREPRTASVKE